MLACGEGAVSSLGLSCIGKRPTWSSVVLAVVPVPGDGRHVMK